ncbi:MAG: hypothetical protein ABJC13_16125 [Acidobacteriota bacterium]
MARRNRTVAGAVLTLLCLPVAGWAHTSETGIDPGTIALRLQAREPSELKVDLQLLELKLCGVAISEHSAGGIVVQGDGGGSGLRSLEIRIVRHAHLEATTQMVLEPTGLLLVGPRPHPTSCGTWDYSVELDPGATQPLSQIELVEDPRNPRTGTSTGILDIAAVIRFTSTNTGVTKSIPYPFALSLNAAWTLIPSGTDMATGRTNLKLFAQGQGGSWFPAPSCVTEVSRGGQLCLEPVVDGN